MSAGTSIALEPVFLRLIEHSDDERAAALVHGIVTEAAYATEPEPGAYGTRENDMRFVEARAVKALELIDKLPAYSAPYKGLEAVHAALWKYVVAGLLRPDKHQITIREGLLKKRKMTEQEARVFTEVLRLGLEHATWNDASYLVLVLEYRIKEYNPIAVRFLLAAIARHGDPTLWEKLLLPRQEIANKET